MKRLERRAVYVDPQDYDELQGRLRQRRSDVSKWFREKVKEELTKVTGRHKKEDE